MLLYQIYQNTGSVNEPVWGNVVQEGKFDRSFFDFLEAIVRTDDGSAVEYKVFSSGHCSVVATGTILIETNAIK